jgi:hypothetical protein
VGAIIFIWKLVACMHTNIGRARQLSIMMIMNCSPGVSDNFGEPF